MKRGAGAERPPLEEGFATVMLAVPGVAMALAAIVAVNFELETNVMVSALPLNCTAASESNADPLIVSVKPELPAIAEPGVNAEITGALCAGTGGSVGTGGGVKVRGGAAPTKFPPSKTIWP